MIREAYENFRKIRDTGDIETNWTRDGIIVETPYIIACSDYTFGFSLAPSFAAILSAFGMFATGGTGLYLLHQSFEWLFIFFALQGILFAILAMTFPIRFYEFMEGDSSIIDGFP